MEGIVNKITLLGILLLGTAVIEVHPRCVWHDMGFRAGSRFSPPGCGTCLCLATDSGDHWRCPTNPECEKEGVILECNHNGKLINAGMTIQSVDGCNYCTCLVGGKLTCTNLTCSTPTPPAKNPTPTCRHRGRIRVVGEVFPYTTQRCHTCECKETGFISCINNCAQCYYNNTKLQLGDKVQALDGCNTCECLEEGRVACTELFCGKTECIYEGKKYAIGDVFQKNGDCNMCDCGVDGEVACSTRDCPKYAPPSGGGIRKNKTCTFQGKRYHLGEEWAWQEGAGPVGPEGAWKNGNGSSCDKCTCVIDSDSKVTWVCTSACTTSSPPAQQRSVWTMVRELLAAAFSRMAKRFG